MMPELRIHVAYSAERARDTTLDDENALQNMTCIVVKALGTCTPVLVTALYVGLTSPKLSLRTSVTTIYSHVTYYANSLTK